MFRPNFFFEKYRVLELYSKFERIRYCPNSIFIENFPKSSETHKTQISSRNSNFFCSNAISEINISCVIAENVDYFVHNIESAFFVKTMFYWKSNLMLVFPVWRYPWSFQSIHIMYKTMLIELQPSTAWIWTNQKDLANRTFSLHKSLCSNF